MPCFSPLHGYKSRRVFPSGKRAVVFSVQDGFRDLPVTVPCGQCIGCRLERSRQWAIRCMHEASLHDENAFVTLTYADEHLPDYGSLDKRAFPLFMKRLRKARAEKVRFFSCGEYGERFGRPHYHALLFGCDFPDKVRCGERGKFPVWQSAELERLWPFGRAELGSVTFESAAYVAAYVVKKVTGSEERKDAAYGVVDGETGEVVRREAEFALMSRRPGIGRPWLERFGCEVYPGDGVVVRGRLMRPPRFYDMWFEKENPGELLDVSRRRRRALPEVEKSQERLDAKGAVARARYDLYRRELE